jgi:serine/threonine protein kinase/tetratricopeptide (TPR) repeat protein
MYMTGESQTAETIFGEAIEIPSPHDRSLFLDRACEGNASLRREVERLVEDHFRAGSFLESPALEEQRTAPINPIAEQPGTIIGPYKLLQQIGEGGMGIVFMAEQSQPLRRTVALKIIKPGMDTRQVIARFEAERQALAMMDHPNIAKVLDAGTMDSGHAYFVMELVKGVPITTYCDEKHLPLRARLELFTQVCHAVQHAHQKGVIHRDIKPTNVLVAEYDDLAVPKIIDFGVAKATVQKLTDRTMFTELGQLVGTVEYMSPEQAKLNQLDIDTRSDIYSLGVLLYELLTGSTPFGRKRLQQATFDEMLRIVCEEEPPKPSTRLSSTDQLAAIAINRACECNKLSGQVKGELDWIVMKALEKDRNRRYSTASSLALDLERHLADEPVEACPPSPMYRFRKFASRNRALLATGCAVALAVMVAVGSLVVSNVRISQEASEKALALAAVKASEQQAVENLEDALAAVDQMLTRVAEDRLLHIPQMEPIRRELLLEALKFYQKFLQKKSDDPEIRRGAALAYGRVGRIQRFLGQYAEAEKAYRSAIGMLEELGGQSKGEPALRARIGDLLRELAWTLNCLGKHEEAVRNMRRAVAIAENLVEDYPDLPTYRTALVSARNQLADALAARQPEEAEQLFRGNLPLADDDTNLEAIHRGLGNVFMTTQCFSEAEQAYRQALNYAERRAAESPVAHWLQSALANDLLVLASALTATQRPQEAEQHVRRAVVIYDQLATNFPASPDYRHGLASAHGKHAGVLKTLGRTTEAEKAYRRVVDLYEKLATDFPTPAFQQIAFDQRLGLGQFLVAAGQPYDAHQILGEARALSGKLPADFPTRLNHWKGLVRSHIELGRLLEIAGRIPEAEEAFRQALAISERLEAEHGEKPDYRRDVARSHFEAAWLLRFDSRHSEAEKLYRWALQHYVRLAKESPQLRQAREDLAFTQFWLADHYRWAPGRLADAEKVFRQALEQYEKLSADFPNVPAYRITIADCRERLASVLLFQGRLQAADQGFEEALALAERLAEEHPADLTVRMTLAMGSRHRGETLRDMARPQEAEGLFRHSVAVLEKLLADFPNESWYRLELGLTCQILVTVSARDLKRPQEAEEFYRRAVTIHEKLAAEFSRDSSYRGWLAAAHREWAFCLRDIGRTQESTEILDLATTNFSKAIELGSKDLWGVWYAQALLLLSADRTEEYSRLCETMLERLGQSKDLDRWIVNICNLAPDAVADLARPVQIAEKILARDPHNADLAGILGAALYRQGLLEAAVQKLEAGIHTAASVSAHSRKLFLAMAYHRLGRAVEARQLLQEVDEWIETNGQEKLSEGAEIKGPLPWSARLDLQLLRRETDELLKQKSGVRQPVGLLIRDS